MKKIKFLKIFSFALFIAFWVVGNFILEHTKQIDLPGPIEVVQKAISLFRGIKLYETSIYSHLFSSLARWVTGFLIAVISGTLIGVVIGLSGMAKKILMPYVTLIQMVPGLAWVPMALIFFGIGNTATVFIIFITAFPPIVINFSGALSEVPTVFKWTSQMIGLTRQEHFFYVLLPATKISYINGVRLATAASWRVLIAAEMVVGASSGLGFTILQSRWSLDFTSTFVSIGIILLIGLFLENFVFHHLENRNRGKR